MCSIDKNKRFNELLDEGFDLGSESPPLPDLYYSGGYRKHSRLARLVYLTEKVRELESELEARDCDIEELNLDLEGRDLVILLVARQVGAVKSGSLDCNKAIAVIAEVLVAYGRSV